MIRPDRRPRESELSEKIGSGIGNAPEDEACCLADFENPVNRPASKNAVGWSMVIREEETGVAAICRRELSEFDIAIIPFFLLIGTFLNITSGFKKSIRRIRQKQGYFILSSVSPGPTTDRESHAAGDVEAGRSSLLIIIRRRTFSTVNHHLGMIVGSAGVTVWGGELEDIRDDAGEGEYMSLLVAQAPSYDREKTPYFQLIST